MGQEGRCTHPNICSLGQYTGQMNTQVNTPLIAGLDHVQIEAPAGCEEAARSFFGGVLGLAELQKPLALQKNGGVWFALPDGKQIHIGVTPGFVPRQKGHPALRCADLEAVKSALAAQGIAFRPDAEAGVARIFLADPWGNRLEIVHGQHASYPLQSGHDPST